MFPLRDGIRLERLPLVTITLVAANVIAYLIAIASGGSIVGGPALATVVHYGAIPYELTHLASHCDLAASGFGANMLCTGQTGVVAGALAQPATWMTALTAMFLHANLLTLALNMAFLAVFGATFEDRVGRGRFLAFYLLGGLAALALAVAAAPDSTTPTLGASGAIAAVLGGYLMLFARTRVLTLVALVRTAELPAWALIGVWFAFDALLGAVGLSTRFGGAGLAYYAHVGGFAFGLLAARAFARGQTPGSYGVPRIA